MLQEFPIQCSTGVFLVGLYLLRWLALFTCAMLTMLISSFMKRMETAYIGTCALVLLPSVLYLYLGLEPLKYLSLVLPVMGMPLLIENSGNSYTIIFVCLLLGVLIGISCYALHGKMKAARKNM